MMLTMRLVCRKYCTRIGADDGVDGEPGEAAEKVEQRGQFVAEFAEPGAPWIICGRPYCTPKVLRSRQQDAAENIRDQDGNEGGAGGKPESAGGKRAGC